MIRSIRRRRSAWLGPASPSPAASASPPAGAPRAPPPPRRPRPRRGTTLPPRQRGRDRRRGGRTFPGASGSVAAITGSSMEVQNPQSGQVTVSWTTKTAFTKTATVTAASVAAGDCVTVTGTTTNGTIVARTVAISKPPAGAAPAPPAVRRLRRRRPPARHDTVDAGRARRRLGACRPTGGRFGGANGISFASGKVTSVTSSALVLSGFSSAGFTRPATGTTPTTATTTADRHRP